MTVTPVRTANKPPIVLVGGVNKAKTQRSQPSDETPPHASPAPTAFEENDRPRRRKRDLLPIFSCALLFKFLYGSYLYFYLLPSCFPTLQLASGHLLAEAESGATAAHHTAGGGVREATTAHGLFGRGAGDIVLGLGHAVWAVGSFHVLLVALVWAYAKCVLTHPGRGS